jgi:hypothetical protein
VIGPDDAQFHHPTSDDPLWGETNYFGLYVAEVPMNIGVYGLFRQNVGTVVTNVSVNSGRVTMPWAADYWDAWAQVPIPESLLDYQLGNGLHVVCIEPNRVWDVSYEHEDVCSLHFRYTALMDPYDINDPNEDPLAAGKDMDLTWGHAYAGHFDETGHFQGELWLRGKRYAIDCVSTMDHSWGIRAERQTSRLCWLHGHFSEDFAVHGLFDFDPSGGPDAPTPLRLTHGYVLDSGKAVGLKAGAGRTERCDFYAQRLRLEVTDAADREWELTAEGLTTFPWQAWPGTVGHNVLARWECAGQVGYGEIMDFIGLTDLTAAYRWD